ncbi:sigma-70 family RNA polymerase sigma factor [Marinicella sediminis]|uniref:Sigma-70 family RNA polymerase sigma factor n=1 Tax=Marinicella sediminis TaxID=1792834 RepID=A0ABV7J587_9GAMM|nr:sigma-70 family RNA polymerase sigma factor [Marinicella sediminis]
MTTTAISQRYNVYLNSVQPSRQQKLQDTVVSAHTLQLRLDQFLRTQQKQAYAIALLNTRHPEDSLDVVQEAMIAFVTAYQHKPDDQWKPLFYRILHNKMNDHHRRKKHWFKYFFQGNDGDQLAVEQAADMPSPASRLITAEQGQALVEYISQLPVKQKQVLIYRHWQQLSVNETARIMQISEGSVKTHLHRAMHKINELRGADHE